WRRRNIRWWKRPLFELKVLRVWMFLVMERIGLAKDLEKSPAARDSNFIVNSAADSIGEVTFAALARRCLEENDRRLAPYDPRLLRPRFVPAMVRLALRLGLVK
ncbi:MAG TPA: hypothetical protein VHZ26_16980, partial [Caulobacteraceae bacterium]|nr:hypothetical protein [Caulobacteraceae bacterium]